MLLMSLEAFAASIVAYRYLRLPFGVGLLSYVSATIILLYASDFLGILRPTSWVIHAIIALSMLLTLFREARARFSQLQTRISLKSTAAVLTLIFCAIQLALFCSAKEYSAWDEFSHWGTVIRVMYEANTFHLHPNPLYFQDYPPGLGLFAYLAILLSGYTETNAYFSYAILLFCFSASIFQIAYRASFVWFYFSLILVWGAVQFWGGGWASVLVDHMLSIYFAGIIGAYFLLRQSSLPILVLALALGAFTLAKQAAASLALLAAAIIVIDWLFECLRRYRASPSAGAAILSRGTAVTIVLLGAATLVPMSWQYYVAASGIPQGWGSYSPYGGLAKLVHCCATDREISVATKFFSAFFGSSAPADSAGPVLLIAWKALTSLSLTDLTSGAVFRAPGFPMLVVALASLVLLVPLRPKAERLQNLIFALLLMAGAAGYVISLLTAYLYTYSDYEADTLAAFDRFLGVYTIAWMFALLTAALRGIRGSRGPLNAIVSAIALLLVILLFWPGIRSSLPIASQAQMQQVGAIKIEARKPIQDWAAVDKGRIPLGAKVYILWPGTSGIEFWLVKYELLPRLTNLDCFGIIPALPKTIIQECVLPDAELKKVLSAYDFVVVGDGMDRLHAEYGDIFPDGPSGKFFLFRVDKSNGLRLVPVGE